MTRILTFERNPIEYGEWGGDQQEQTESLFDETP